MANSNDKFIDFEIKTYADSVRYVKKLILIAISNISYLRALFPEDMYTMRRVETLQIKICNLKNTLVSGWMRALIDGIDKKYLDGFTILIYTDENNPDRVVETYDFKLNYLADELQLANQEDLKLDALGLIKSIWNAVSKLNDLPPRLFMNMRLLFNDSTPDDYAPEGFRRESEEETIADYEYPDGYTEMKLTENCGYADISLNCSSSLLKDSFSSSASSQSQSSRLSSIKFELNCCCQVTDNQVDFKEVIQCRKCLKYQHSVCYGILPSNLSTNIKQPKSHECLTCSNYQTNLPKSVDRYPLLSFFRIILIRMTRYNNRRKVNVRDLMSNLDIKPSDQELIWHELVTSEVVLKTEKKTFAFNKPQLKRLISQYFGSFE